MTDEGDDRGDSPDHHEESAAPAARFPGDDPPPESWQPQYGPGGPPFGGYQQQVQPPWTGAIGPTGPTPRPVIEPVSRRTPSPESQEMAAEPAPGPQPSPGHPRPAEPPAPPGAPRARRARTTGGYRPPPEIIQEQVPPPAPPAEQPYAPADRFAAPAPQQPAPPAEQQPSEPAPYTPAPYSPGPYDATTYEAQPELPRVGPYDQQASDLSSAQLLRPTKRPPRTGWRKAVYAASGRTINLGESPTDVGRRELVARVNQPLQGCYKIAMLSLKGGVGKTTTTTTLGATFASLRGDRVVAVDANPDRGTLAQKQPLETSATVRHLLHDANRIRRYSDVRAYTSQGASRLEIIASEQDPAVSEAFSEDDYRRAVEVLEHFYNIVLTDCGTGLMHSAMRGVLDLADCLVVVSSASIDAARSASATLDWLDAHGYRELTSRSIAVINSVRPKSGSVDVDRLAAHFESRCRAVCRIPFDSHLEEGAEIDMERLAAPTRDALLELAATVADDFPHAVSYNQR